MLIKMKMKCKIFTRKLIRINYNPLLNAASVPNCTNITFFSKTQAMALKSNQSYIYITQMSDLHLLKIWNPIICVQTWPLTYEKSPHKNPPKVISIWLFSNSSTFSASQIILQYSNNTKKPQSADLHFNILLY